MTNREVQVRLTQVVDLVADVSDLAARITMMVDALKLDIAREQGGRYQWEQFELGDDENVNGVAV